MTSDTSRRTFLGGALAAGSCCALSRFGFGMMRLPCKERDVIDNCNTYRDFQPLTADETKAVRYGFGTCDFTPLNSPPKKRIIAVNRF